MGVKEEKTHYHWRRLIRPYLQSVLKRIKIKWAYVPNERTKTTGIRGGHTPTHRVVLCEILLNQMCGVGPTPGFVFWASADSWFQL